MNKPSDVQVNALSNGPKNHFYGYYGINPWDKTGRYHLALETDFHEHRPIPEDVAAIGLIDRETGVFTPYAETSAFNLQQGSMLHWIDAGFGEEFTFNDWEDGRVVSRALNPSTQNVRTIQGGIAATSPTEPIAMGLNYGRMAHCRAVVGYANDIDPTQLADAPEDDGLYLLNLQNGESRLVVSLAEVIEKSLDERVQGRRAWFNHVLFNTDGSRILFFCRARHEPRMYTSLWTVNPDGSELELQIPFGHRISHFAWRDPKRILVSTDVLGEMHFIEFTDRERNFAPFGKGVLPSDGHACYSPDTRWLACDAYPKNPQRLAELMLYNVARNTKIPLGQFHSEPQFTGDTRCDLHPRWSPDGRFITFDSVHENWRQIYIVDVSEIVGRNS